MADSDMPVGFVTDEYSKAAHGIDTNNLKSYNIAIECLDTMVKRYNRSRTSSVDFLFIVLKPCDKFMDVMSPKWTLHYGMGVLREACSRHGGY